MNYYRVQTTAGIFLYCKKFWAVHASGNVVNLLPRKEALVGKQTYTTVCRNEQKRLKTVQVKAAINERGLKPALLIFNARILSLPVTDKALDIVARIRTRERV